jgi:hypothetical protein
MASISLMQFCEDEAVFQTMVGVGVLPQLINLLLEFHEDDALFILSQLANHKDFSFQLLSLHLLLNLTKSFETHPDFKDKCDGLFSKLLRQASTEQLIPVFSYLIPKFHDETSSSQPASFSEPKSDYGDDYQYYSPEYYCYYGDGLFPTTLILEIMENIGSSVTLAETRASVDFVDIILFAMAGEQIHPTCLQRCYKILSSIFLNSQVIKPDGQVLNSWRLFLDEAPQQNIKMSNICPLLLEIITRCDDLNSLIKSGLISSMFRVSGRWRNEEFVDWVLNLITSSTGKRRAVIGRDVAPQILLAHLVDLGALSLLADSFAVKFSETYHSSLSTSAVVSAQNRLKKLSDGLHMIVEVDEKYEARFKMTRLMKRLLPQDEESEYDLDFESYESQDLNLDESNGDY